MRDLEEELRRAQSSINVEIDLGDLEASEEASATDIENAWRKVRRDPANPEALRELGQALKASGEDDRRLFELPRPSWCSVRRAPKTNGGSLSTATWHYRDR